MTPTFLNLEPSPPNYFIDVNEDQHHQFFSPKLQAASSSSSSFSYSIDQGHFCWESPQLGHQQEVINYSETGLDSPIWKKEDRAQDHGESSEAAEWTSSNMSLPQKTEQSSALKIPIKNIMPMFGGDHSKQLPYSSSENDYQSNTPSNVTIRVCTDCNTTKTPLWRSGPRGPKSLCNACGIRQRKARRAMVAAANDIVVAPTKTKPMKIKVQHKEKKFNKGYVAAAEYKKKCKQVATATGSSSSDRKKNNNNNKLCFEEFITISLRKNSAFPRVFPQDEKEAAILLMALSSGLVHG